LATLWVIGIASNIAVHDGDFKMAFASRKFKLGFLLAAFLSLTAIMLPTQQARAGEKAPVIEVVTLKLKPGVSTADFKPVDKAVENEYVSKQPGFVSRESAPGKAGTWLVIVHWRSVADADAAMNSFSTAPATSKFMSMIVPESIVMTRYGE
jgi:hypothetical protein